MADFKGKMSSFRDKMKQKFLGEEPRGDHPSSSSSSSSPAGQASTAPGASPVRAASQQAIDVYLMSKQGGGEVGGIGWWQNANGYTALALHDLYAGDARNLAVLSQALKQCERQRPNFVNEFNDDSLWWALCAFHVYRLGHDRWFLDRAQAVWDHLVRSGSVCRPGQARFRGEDMAGACFWTTKPGEEQINAITTALFAELSLRLASLDPAQLGTPRDAYVDAARHGLTWILRHRYRREEAVVLDHILLQKQEAVDWTFTYSTGVVIGASALLYQATGEPQPLADACDMARQAMKRDSWVERDGVLTERGTYGRDNHDASQNDDAVGFKAILIRHLAVLYHIIGQSSAAGGEARETAERIRSFLQVNFRSQQERNTNGNGQYGPWWNGPFETPTSHSQMAVLDVMAAAVLVQ